MAISVLTALEFDQVPISNKFALIEENNTSDASFIVSTFLEEALKKNHKIFILLFHNSIGHYQAISKKLGYNLLDGLKQGDVFVYDFLKIMVDGISPDGTPPDENILKDLFLELRQKVIDCSADDITLVIDNAGDLLLLGFPLEDVIFFMHYCKTLLYDYKNVNIACLTHNFLDSRDCDIFVNGLRYDSYMSIVVDDFKTGRASDITGRFSVKWRTDDLMQWKEPNEYHYQLLDKNVNVFIPGMKDM